MLVLTRKKDESIMINDNIEITIVDIGEDRVRIGINAPKEMKIFRKEIYRELAEENTLSMNILADIKDASKILKK